MNLYKKKAKIARETNAELKLKNKNYDPTDLMPEFESIKQDIEEQDIVVLEVNLLGSKENLEMAKSKSKNKTNIEVFDIKSNRPKAENIFSKVAKTLSGTVTASAAYENTLPKTGATYFGQNGNTRWNYNTMKWTSNNFGYNDTYEHEVYLWNGNNSEINHTTYLSQDNQTWQNSLGQTFTACFPLIQNAYSNLPNAYLDTRLNEDWQGLYCDNDWSKTSEVSYTIGTTTASDIATNTWYYTEIDTSLGQRNKPVFKTQGQTGYNLPYRVYGNVSSGGYNLSTWTNFGYSGGATRLIQSASGDYITNPYFSPNGYYVEGFYR
jgi:hypothetical protein